jgi:hypothetical protein
MANLRASLNKPPGQTTPVQTGMMEDSNPGLKAVRRHSAQDMKTLLLPKQDTGTVLRRKGSREAPASLGHSTFSPTAMVMPTQMMGMVVNNDLFCSSNALGPKKVTFSGLPVISGVPEEDEDEEDHRAHQAPVKSLPTKPRPTPPPKPHHEVGTPAPAPALVHLSVTPSEESTSELNAEIATATDEANGALHPSPCACACFVSSCSVLQTNSRLVTLLQRRMQLGEEVTR